MVQKCFLLWSSKGCFLFIQQKQPPEYFLSISLFFPTFTTQCRYEIEHNGLVDKIIVLWHPSSFQIWTFNVITDFFMVQKLCKGPVWYSRFKPNLKNGWLCLFTFVYWKLVMQKSFLWHYMNRKVQSFMLRPRQSKFKRQRAGLFLMFANEISMAHFCINRKTDYYLFCFQKCTFKLLVFKLLCQCCKTIPIYSYSKSRVFSKF